MPSPQSTKKTTPQPVLPHDEALARAISATTARVKGQNEAIATNKEAIRSELVRISTLLLPHFRETSASSKRFLELLGQQDKHALQKAMEALTSSARTANELLKAENTSHYSKDGSHAVVAGQEAALQASHLLLHGTSDTLNIITRWAAALFRGRSDPNRKITFMTQKTVELDQIIGEIELASPEGRKLGENEGAPSDAGKLLFDNMLRRSNHEPPLPLPEGKP